VTVGSSVLSTWRLCGSYGLVMSKWPKNWRPESAKDAQAYLDAHQNGGGDPDLIEECERLVDASRPRARGGPTGPGGATRPSPFT
jgi:hypothetical protein